MFEEHSLKVQRSAHFYTIGQPGPHIVRLWIVCHGYGQLASSFIEKFKDLDDGKTLIIAPEGLSRFYWLGFSGNIVASWMTSKNRLEEIDDYCNMLDHIYQKYIAQLSPEVQINLMGFSQGCATHCRWIVARQPLFHRLILWAGAIPEDLDYRPLHDYFQSKEIFLLYGDKDQLLSPETIEKIRQLIKDKGLQVKILPFAGKHEVKEELLISLFGEKS